MSQRVIDLVLLRLTTIISWGLTRPPACQRKWPLNYSELRVPAVPRLGRSSSTVLKRNERFEISEVGVFLSWGLV